MPASTSRKEQSHDRIVEVAARAIRRAGYRGVGVADIMKEAGLTHGGFYAHFASRDDMLVEAMRHASRESGGALMEHVVQREAQGESRFKAMVEAYLADEQLDNAECGCIVAALLSEMPRQDDAVRDEARQRVLNMINAVRSTLPDGVDAAHADAIAATLIGSMQMARTLGGKAGRALLARSRETLLNEYEPKRAR